MSLFFSPISSLHATSMSTWFANRAMRIKSTPFDAMHLVENSTEVVENSVAFSGFFDATRHLRKLLLLWQLKIQFSVFALYAENYLHRRRDYRRIGATALNRGFCTCSTICKLLHISHYPTWRTLNCSVSHRSSMTEPAPEPLAAEKVRISKVWIHFSRKKGNFID